MRFKLTTSASTLIYTVAIALNFLNSTHAYAENNKLPIGHETLASNEKELDVVGEDSKISCPTKLVQGEIIGVTHAVHQGMLSITHTGYKRAYTIFSIAVGDHTFTTRYPGIVHKKDFIGAVTMSDCREPTAAVIAIGPLLSPKK